MRQRALTTATGICRGKGSNGVDPAAALERHAGTLASGVGKQPGTPYLNSILNPPPFITTQKRAIPRTCQPKSGGHHRTGVTEANPSSRRGGSEILRLLPLVQTFDGYSSIITVRTLGQRVGRSI